MLPHGHRKWGCEDGSRGFQVRRFPAIWLSASPAFLGRGNADRPSGAEPPLPPWTRSHLIGVNGPSIVLLNLGC